MLAADNSTYPLPLALANGIRGPHKKRGFSPIIFTHFTKFSCNDYV